MTNTPVPPRKSPRHRLRPLQRRPHLIELSFTGKAFMAIATNRTTGWAEIGWDVLLIVAGVLALILPPLAGIGFEILVGWLLLFGGVAHMVFAFRSRAESGGFIWKVFVGLAYVVCGIYFLLFPIGGLDSLTLALAIFLLVEGTLETILFF